MTLDMSFWAADDADATRQGLEWIAAEPNVESGTVVKVRRIGDRPTLVGPHNRYTVTVELTFRGEPEQDMLWGAS